MYQRIAQRLAHRRRRAINAPKLKKAAVLVPVFFDPEQELGIILIARTENITHHRGQVSFPGGAQQRGDANLEATALRETAEEIGLNPQDVQILGWLDDVQTRSSKFLVTPIVGTVPYRYHFKMNPDEVADIIRAPIRELVSLRGVKGKEYRINRIRIWGATARILSQLMEFVQ